MELITQIGFAIVAVSLLAVYISFSVSSMNEKSYRRMKRRNQRDRNERHIAEIKAELRLLSERVSKLES
jgi:hypothetical protein